MVDLEAHPAFRLPVDPVEVHADAALDKQLLDPLDIVERRLARVRVLVAGTEGGAVLVHQIKATCLAVTGNQRFAQDVRPRTRRFDQLRLQLLDIVDGDFPRRGA